MSDAEHDAESEYEVEQSEKGREKMSQKFWFGVERQYTDEFISAMADQIYERIAHNIGKPFQYLFYDLRRTLRQETKLQLQRAFQVQQLTIGIILSFVLTLGSLITALLFFSILASTQIGYLFLYPAITSIGVSIILIRKKNATKQEQ